MRSLVQPSNICAAHLAHSSRPLEWRMIMEAYGNRSQSLLEWLTNDEKAAVLRSHARYEVLVD